MNERGVGTWFWSERMNKYIAWVKDIPERDGK